MGRRAISGLVPMVAVLAGASACGGWRSDDAARVDGVGIDAGRLQDDTRELLARPAVAEALLGSGAALTAPTGTGGDAVPEGRLPTAAVAGLLDRRIVEVLAERELADRGIAVTEADRTDTEQAIRDRLTAAQATAAPTAGQSGDPVADFDSLPGGLRQRLVASDAAARRLRQELAGEELEDFPQSAQAWYQDNQEQFEEYCLSVVPVADEAEGRRVAAESASGQVPLPDLVARQRGQEAGCGFGYQLREQLQPELAEALVDAPVGRAVGPFPGSDGSQILVGVSSRTPQPFDAVEAEATQRYEADRAGLEDGPWQEWLAEQRPEVSIDPRYGTWDAENHTVRPPEGTRTPSGGLSL